MPKLRCPCGFIHDLSPIPDAGWITIPDAAYDDVIDAHIRQRGIGKTKGSDDPKEEEWILAEVSIFKASGLLYECPTCGRLMWKKPGEETFTVYVKASP